MAKIGYIVISEEVFNEMDHIMIRRPFNVIAPYSIPGNFSFVLSFSLIDLKKDEKYSLKIEIIEPDETILLRQDIEFEFNPPETEKAASGTANLKFNNIVFKKLGIHTFKVTIDDEFSNKTLVPVIPSGQ